MKKILLIEDDPGIVKLLALHLCLPEFNLITHSTGLSALEELKKQDFSLLILDVMLPDVNGIEICKLIRETNKIVPIMMLTAKSEEFDKVLALELGADDYLTKPFGVMELLARVKALIRRSVKAENKFVKSHTIIHIKNLSVDTSKRKVEFLNDKGEKKRIELTPKEFELLLLFVENPGKNFSREELLKQIWGYTFHGYEHTVTAHINRLRIKIEPEIANPQYILTSWGIGYRFVE
jgi:two-component system, OmpR family, alkaline phosphatase synthesis response regulator PhoP